MRKISDRVILGIVCGLIAGIPGRLINASEYKLKLTDYKYNQLAASLFIPKNKTKTSEGKALAALVNNTNICLVGVMITYLLSATGRDKAIVKGMGVGATSWLFINGVVAHLGFRRKSRKPLSPILSFLDHLIFGSLTGWLVSQLGEDRLFPDKDQKVERLPLIYTGEDQ